MKNFKLFILAILCSLPSIAFSEDMQWKTVGQARLQVLFWPVYQAKLATTNGKYTGNQLPARLELQYLRDFKAQALLDSTEDEWQHLGINNPNSKTWINQLQRIWPDISQNDRLAIVVDSDSYSYFYWNDKFIGSVDDPEFSQAFLDIWLSKNSSQPKNRELLVGNNS